MKPGLLAPFTVAAAVAVLATAPALAQQGATSGAKAPNQNQSSQNQASRNQDNAGVNWPGFMHSRMRVSAASDLIGRSLNVGGKPQGTIKFLMIRVDDGKVIYALASPAGANPVGRFIAVPWDAINVTDTWAGARTTGFELKVSQKKLDQAQRFSVEDIVNLTSPIVHQELIDYYAPVAAGSAQAGNQQAQSQKGKNQKGKNQQAQQQGQQGGAQAGYWALVGSGVVSTVMSPPAMVANQVTGSEVVTSDGKSLGEIDELMVDVDEGRVPYALISSGGFLGSGEQWIAIPPQALEWQNDTPKYALDMSAQEVEKLPKLSKSGAPASVRRSDLDRLYQAYGVDRYWTSASGRQAASQQ